MHRIVQFTAHNCDPSQPLKDYTVKRLARLERHAERIISIRVIFEVDKLRQVVKILLHLPKAELVAHHATDDMYKTIDGIIDKLDRQITHYKGKLKGKIKEKYNGDAD